MDLQFRHFYDLPDEKVLTGKSFYGVCDFYAQQKARQRRSSCVIVRLLFNALGYAEGGTRTPMSHLTRPSNVRVYQFRHFG